MAGILSFLSSLRAHQLTIHGGCNRWWQWHPLFGTAANIPFLSFWSWAQLGVFVLDLCMLGHLFSVAFSPSGMACAPGPALECSESFLCQCLSFLSASFLKGPVPVSGTRCWPLSDSLTWSAGPHRAWHYKGKSPSKRKSWSKGGFWRPMDLAFWLPRDRCL